MERFTTKIGELVDTMPPKLLTDQECEEQFLRWHERRKELRRQHDAVLDELYEMDPDGTRAWLRGREYRERKLL